jgi:hypothetical protein
MPLMIEIQHVAAFSRLHPATEAAAEATGTRALHVQRTSECQFAIL